jgi:hypothetical protein
MHPADLDALPAHRPLDARDRQVLERLKQTALPAPLHALAAHLDAQGHKGEQEGLFVRPPGQARLDG